mmetsp:Transcript_46428/g.68598  ORF Transcript_46428/g.68598 Transcript_46428/m.68598 type:complete len:169 (+) Transcript_46428:121-627(+)
MPGKSHDLVTVAAVTVGAAVATVGTCVALLAVQLTKRRKKFNTPQAIFTNEAGQPAGHYSQAITHRGKMYISGLLPVTANGDNLSGKPFEQQVACVLNNLKTILDAGGSSVSKLVHCRVYISDIDSWGQFNELFADFCGPDTRPARCVIPCPALHNGSGIELEAIAAL